MIGKCDNCGKWSLSLKKESWHTGPGRGKMGYLCPACPVSELDWHKRIGLDRICKDRDATYVKLVGTPRITGNYENAFGSVLALYSDGSKIGFICGHGGSEWLCYSCAVKALEKQEEHNG